MSNGAPVSLQTGSMGQDAKTNARDPLRTYARLWRICKVAKVGEEMVGTGCHLHSRKKSDSGGDSHSIRRSASYWTNPSYRLRGVMHL